MGVAFTTGPYRTVTHWKQGVLLIEKKNGVEGELVRGDRVRGEVEYRKRKENSRELEIEVRWVVEKGGGWVSGDGGGDGAGAGAGAGKGEGKWREQMWYMR